MNFNDLFYIFFNRFEVSEYGSKERYLKKKGIPTFILLFIIITPSGFLFLLTEHLWFSIIMGYAITGLFFVWMMKNKKNYWWLDERP